jgi:hypothetical protein
MTTLKTESSRKRKCKARFANAIAARYAKNFAAPQNKVDVFQQNFTIAPQRGIIYCQKWLAWFLHAGLP